MAESRELSLETMAILDRLKREGDLLRNSGTNSIKSVKIELAKFSGLFETISSSFDAQADNLRAAAGFSEDAALAQQRQNELLEAAGVTEEERAELEKRRFQSEKLKADQDFKDQEEREKKRAENEKGFFGKLKGFFSKETFGKIMTGIKFGVLGAVGLTLGYDFITGLLRGMGFDVDKFEKGFADGFNEFVTFLKDVDWKGIGETLKIFATPEALLAATGLSLLPSAIGLASDAALTSAALSAMRGRNAPMTTVPVGADGKPTKPDAPDAKGKGGRFNLKSVLKGLPKNPLGLLVSALGLSAVYFSEEIGEIFKDEASNATRSDIENAPVDASDLSTIGGFATAGSLFGIKGMLIGALVGGAYVLGKKVVEGIDDAINDTGELTNELERVLKIEQNPMLLRRAQAQARRTGEAIKTFEEVAVGEVERLNTEIQQGSAELEELRNKPLDTKGLSRGGVKAAQRRRDNAIKKLEEEIALRQKQLQTVEQTLEQRREQGVADLDVNTAGYQTTFPEVVSPGIQAQKQLALENTFDALGLDMQSIMNPYAAQASNVDSTNIPPMLIDNSSVTQGGTTINNITNQASNASSTTIIGSGGNPGNVYGSGSISQ